MKKYECTNKKNNIFKNSNGITLISLIVTLIVIIIIATITISISIGGEGVFTIMSQEKEKFDDKTSRQEDKIDNLYKQIEDGIDFRNNYTEVEYIKSTGTQYIDTGVNPANTVDFEIDFRTDYNHRSQESANNSGSESMFGYISSNINKSYEFNFGGGVSQFSIFLWKNNTYENGAKVVYFSTEQPNNPTDRIKIESKNDVWKVNGNTVDTADSIGEWKDENATLYVFGSNWDSQLRCFYDSMYVYGLKIWDSSRLIRDFVPCIRNSDSKPGLYDKVNHNFYTNNGTGEFVTP